MTIGRLGSWPVGVVKRLMSQSFSADFACAEADDERTTCKVPKVLRASVFFAGHALWCAPEPLRWAGVPFRGSVDKPALSPLPTKRFDLSEWSRSQVNIDYHTAFDRNDLPSDN